LVILSSLLLILISTHPSPTSTYTLSLHDALPISDQDQMRLKDLGVHHVVQPELEASISIIRKILVLNKKSKEEIIKWLRHLDFRSEEHTSELQSRFDLVCRLLLEKKKKKYKHNTI